MIHSPIIIIGCPRSGTTLLFNILSEVPSLWSIGYESKAIIERYHHPRTKGWESGALEAGDLTSESRAFILDAFAREAAPGTFWRRVNRFRAGLRENPAWKAVKRRGRSQETGSAASSALPQQGLNAVRKLVQFRNKVLPGNRTPIRLLEKTPENCLRLPFLLALFPDARIIYLTRDGRANVNSLIEGWRHPFLFSSYTLPEPMRIPGITRAQWAFTLVPGWRDLLGSPLADVCAQQWVACNKAVLTHQEQAGGRVPYLRLRYEDVITHPAAAFRRVADFIDVDFESTFGHLRAGLPQINVVSAPDPDKWKHQNGAEIARILPRIAPMMDKLGYGGDS